MERIWNERVLLDKIERENIRMDGVHANSDFVIKASRIVKSQLSLDNLNVICLQLEARRTISIER